MQIRSAFFYADGGLIALIQTECLQGDFDTLTGLFDRMRLRTNVENTFRIICCPCHVFGTRLEEAYYQRMTEAGLTYRPQQKLWVRCTDCAADLPAGLLVEHCQIQYDFGMITHYETPSPTPPHGEPQTYIMSLS